MGRWNTPGHWTINEIAQAGLLNFLQYLVGNPYFDRGSLKEELS